jgi:glycosyltransferase involved in cell wall biosynthesis
MNSPDERVFGAQRPPRPTPADGGVRVLYHGGTAPRFGVETLIRAFEHLRSTTPRVSLRICGSGEERAQLAALAAKIAPERIDVAPEPVPFRAIPDELSAAHIGVVPTLSDAFTDLLLPVKLLEYVHMGLPVVSSRLPGITSYFSGDELRLVEPGDPALVAEAIEDVCANPEAAHRRAVRAADRLAEIGWDRQRERYLELVDELAQLDRRRLRPRLAAMATSAG